jgi:chorismate synthase
LKEMKVATLKIEGRHDPCIVPRAVAVVEGATAFVLADLCKRGGFLG